MNKSQYKWATFKELYEFIVLDMPLPIVFGILFCSASAVLAL